MNKMKQLFSCIICACFFLLPISTIQIHAAEYEIVFKAGAHGSVDGEKEVRHRLSSEQSFPDEPVVKAEEGYVFKGWNKELPAVGSKVNQKAVYVAKYGVVIDGVTYTVRYVDENKVDIAAPKTMLQERSAQVQERAKTVPGYTVKQLTLDFTVEEGMEVFFEYQLTNPNEVIRYETIIEEEIINQVDPNTPQNQDTPQTPNNPTPPVGNEGDENQPNQPNQPEDGDDEIDINDPNTPQADGKSSINPMLMLSFGILFLIGILILLLYWKKGKKDKEEGNLA